VSRPRSPRSLTRLFFAAATVVALGAAGCGGAEDVERSDFESDLRERTTVPQSVSECLTERIYDEFDQGEVNRIYRAATETELDADTKETLAGFNRACFEAEAEAEAAPADAGGATTTDAPTDDGAPTTTEAPTEAPTEGG
jgi:hypothetical protein